MRARRLAALAILSTSLTVSAENKTNKLVSFTVFRDGKAVNGVFTRVSGCNGPTDPCAWSSSTVHIDQEVMAARVQFGDFDLVLMGAEAGRPSKVLQVLPDVLSSSPNPRYYLYWGGPWVVVRGSRPIIEEEDIVVLAGIGEGPPGAATQPAGVAGMNIGDGVRAIEHRAGNGARFLYALAPANAALVVEVRRVGMSTPLVIKNLAAGERRFINISDITATAAWLDVASDASASAFVAKITDLLKSYDDMP